MEDVRAIISSPAIDSNHLRIFVMLAHVANMSRAAEELGMTASGVSHCLKTLEEDLGCRLFDRDSRKFNITDAGREVLVFAEQILTDMQTMRGKLKKFTDLRKGRLVIGAKGVALQYLLGPTLREFRESFPDYSIKIERCSPAEAISKLEDGRLDMAVMHSIEHCPGSVTFYPIGEEDLQFVVNSLHPWAIKRKVRLDDIAHRKLILPERSAGTYALIESYFSKEGIRIQPFMEIANEQAIKEFIRLDMGIGILPRWMVADEINEGALVALPLGRRHLKRHWGVFLSGKRATNLPEFLFINIATKVFRRLTGSSEEENSMETGA